MIDRTEALTLGIEIGGTKLQVGAGDSTGRLLDLERGAVDPARGASGVLDTIAAISARLLDRCSPRPEAIAAVGIGFGGPVDPTSGRVLESHQVAGWTDFDLAGWARATFRTDRVAIQNDADTAGFAEAVRGAGRGYDPVLYLTIGSGIGGGLISGGRIYRGGGLGALEIGHLWIRLEGEPPAKLEQIASGWAIGRAARERLTPDSRSILLDLPGAPATLTGLDVGRAAELRDRFALGILERARAAMIQALGHAVTLLSPRRIILGGGVSLLPAALWLDPIQAGLDAWVFPSFRGTFDVVSAALGEEVVVHGALALAADAIANRPE
ncbi:MAG: ROK family protein [Isosphaeraceae bacterium]|nr:ROK family protein [Isosphaeraceae bacterium]